MTDEMKAEGKIVPGSGTDELEHITGTIEFHSDENGKTLSLHYSIAD